MKSALAISAIFLLGAVAAAAEPGSTRRFSNPLLTDVVQMTRAGLSDATIVAYVKARQARLDADVSADDLIRLRQAGVSETVVRYIAGSSGIDSPSAERGQEMTYDSRDGAAIAVEPAYGEDEPYDYAYGYPYWGGYYPYWYAYSPYFSGTFFIGGGFHSRGSFRGGHFRGGRGGIRGHFGGRGRH